MISGMMISVPPNTHAGKVYTERLLCVRRGTRDRAGEGRVSELKGSLEIILPNLCPLKIGKLSHGAILKIAQQAWNSTQAPTAHSLAPCSSCLSDVPPPPPPFAPGLFWPENRRTASHPFLDHSGGSKGISRRFHVLSGAGG